VSLLPGKAQPVTAIVVAMLVILGVAGVTTGIVVVGIEGRWKDRAPRLADRMHRAAEHLNGDAQHSHR
jgi:hypothetical protein